MVKERNQRIKSQILPVLAKNIAGALEDKALDFDGLQEIRLRADKPLVVVYRGKELFVKGREEMPVVVTGRDIRETVDYISSYSLYAYEHEMRQGFITIEGGHRVGMAGQTVVENQ